MIKVIDIQSPLLAKKMLKGREPTTPEEDVEKAFAIAAETAESKVFVGSFSGESAWERHSNGDELVQILDGSTAIIVYSGGIEQAVMLDKGMVTLIPRGLWHRFHSPGMNRHVYRLFHRLVILFGNIHHLLRPDQVRFQ